MDNWENNQKIIIRKHKESDALIEAHKSGEISTSLFLEQHKKILGKDCDMEGWKW